MIKINLLPVKEAEKKQKVLNQLLVGLLVIIVACALMGWLFIGLQSEVETMEKNIADIKMKQKEYKNVEDNIKKLEKTESRLKKKMDSIKKLQKGRESFIKVLDKVSESVPPNQVWLSSLDFNGEAGGKITLQGNAYDKDAVAVFMGNLAIIPCDDEKDVKHPICVKRNEACLRPETEQAGSISKWEHSECKAFYDHIKEELDEMRSWKKNNPNCKSNCKAIDCKNTDNVSRCEKNKESCIQNCEEQLKKLKKLEENYKKLHEEEYINYNSIKLDYLRTKGRSRGATSQTYDFRMEMNAAK